MAQLLGMSDRPGFMTPHHHAVRNFVVRELPRHGAAAIAAGGNVEESRRWDQP